MGEINGYALQGASCGWIAWNGINQNGERLQKWGDGGIDLPGEPQVDQWYHLEIDAEGNNISFYIDGELVLQKEDEWNPSGGVGLWAYDAAVEFDNLVVTGEEIPDIGPSGYAVEPSAKLAATWGGIRSLK